MMKTCKICGKEFDSGRADAKTCSDECCKRYKAYKPPRRHFNTVNAKLIRDNKAAKEAGLTYGEYMARK